MDRKWVSGDLHQHSHYSSALYGGDDTAPDSLEEIYQFMRSKGLSFGAASDHHNILNHHEWKKFESQDFIPIISKEISTGRGHVMALNTPKDVFFKVENEDDDSLRKEFIRICDEIRSLGGIAQINHPRERKASLSFPERFYDIIEIFDTFEIWNGSEKMEPGTKNGDAFEVWLTLLKKDIFIPITSGSDCHVISQNKPERLIKTVVSIEAFKLDHILNAIKRGNSFLTSGPFVDILVDGKSYGEIVEHNGEVTIDIMIESSEEVDKLYIYDNVHPVMSYDLISKEYHNRIKLNVSDVKWMFFVVGSNTFNKAITNPIFLKVLK